MSEAIYRRRMLGLAPESTVVRREMHLGRVWNASALRVLADDEQELLAVRTPGSEVVFAAGYPGSMAERGFTTGDWDLEHGAWQHTIALCRVLPDRWYSVIHFHDPDDGAFRCWYVNFERPPVARSGIGLYDTLDLALDLIVMPDGGAAWKDEDHWAWLQSTGLLTDADIAGVESSRERLLDAAASGAPPFDGRHLDFEALENLEPVRLPEGWEQVPDAT